MSNKTLTKIHCKSCSLTSLQAINVLRVISQKQSLLLEQLDKVVNGVWLVASGIELLGQGEEWLWVVNKKGDVENGRGVRDFVLLEVVVETSAWGPNGIQVYVYMITCWRADITTDCTSITNSTVLLYTQQETGN